MSEELKKTSLYQHYVDAGAKIVEFGGWAMPVQFSSIKEEHNAVRTNVGLFDVSHMGKFALKVQKPHTLFNMYFLTIQTN